jgi:hypothetical protein
MSNQGGRTVKRVVQSVSSGSLELVNLQGASGKSSVPSVAHVSIDVRTPDVLEEVDGGVGRDVGRVKGKLLELGRVDVAADGCERAARRSGLRNSMRLKGRPFYALVRGTICDCRREPKGRRAHARSQRPGRRVFRGARACRRRRNRDRGRAWARDSQRGCRRLADRGEAAVSSVEERIGSG